MTIESFPKARKYNILSSAVDTSNLFESESSLEHPRARAPSDITNARNSYRMQNVEETLNFNFSKFKKSKLWQIFRKITAILFQIDKRWRFSVPKSNVIAFCSRWPSWPFQRLLQASWRWLSWAVRTIPRTCAKMLDPKNNFESRPKLLNLMIFQQNSTQI